jgi:carboxypeptidase family protein/matrixin
VRPSPPNVPTPPPPPSAWALSGQVVATISRQPIARATVEMSDATASTDNEGRFTLTAPAAPVRGFAVTVRADGYRTRETTIAYPRAGEPVIDLTATAAPFNEGFYNQIARDTHDRPEQRDQLWRWTSAPRVYLKTTDETGLAAPPEVLTVVTAALVDGVRLFSSGAFGASIEQGPGARPAQAGWINVEIRRTIEEGDHCGLASSVGGNPSRLQVRLERCGCGSIKIPASVVLHEVGHALGFFHVSDRESVMYPFNSGECRQQTLSPLEHVGIVYARPRGNLDPDRDPATFSFFTAPASGIGARGPIP